MSEVRFVDLSRRVPGTNGIAFLRAEWWDARSRFALIRYALGGKEQEFGLRLDLDKRVLLDHLDDDETDNLLQEHVNFILQLVVDERRQNF